MPTAGDQNTPKPKRMTLDTLGEMVANDFASVDKRFDAVEKKIETDVHALAEMTSKGFEDLEKRLDAASQVHDLDRRMKKIESALQIRS